MSRIRRLLRESYSFTLIELLISVVLVLILTGAISIVYNTGLKVFYSQFTRAGIKGEAGRAFLSMSQDLQQATSITSALAGSLTFTADTNNDGVDETIQYTWSGSPGAPLNRISSSITVPLVSSVSTAAFSYYDSNNTLLTFPVTASKVKLVAIDLTASRGNESIRLRTKIDLRNL